MASRHISLRIDQSCYEALEAESKRNRESLSELARRLIEEGLRMQKHPGIFFKNDPPRRRAALADGPSVWVVARILRDRDLTSESVLAEASELQGLDIHQVRTAARYYAEYKHEIDDWMDRLDEESDKAYAEWLAGQPPVPV